MGGLKKEKSASLLQRFSRATCGMSTRRATRRPESTPVLASGGDGRSLTGRFYSGTSEVGSFADVQRASPAAGLHRIPAVFQAQSIGRPRGDSSVSARQSVTSVNCVSSGLQPSMSSLFFSFLFFPLFYEGLRLGAGL